MKKYFFDSKVALGLALLTLGLILVLGQKPKSLPPQPSFAGEPVKVEGFSVNASQEKTVPVRIIIPSLSIDLPVKEAKIVKGYWEVFNDSAGWGEGSGQPGKPGNQVIFAHARDGLFLPLKDIKIGDDVYVLTQDDWFAYKIEGTKEVYPSQVEVIAPTNDETLTLYTCSGYNDTTRLIVTAKRD